MSAFRFILLISNTDQIIAPFPYGDTCVQGLAKVPRMPAMIAQADLDNLSRPVHAHTIIMHLNRK